MVAIRQANVGALLMAQEGVSRNVLLLLRVNRRVVTMGMVQGGEEGVRGDPAIRPFLGLPAGAARPGNPHRVGQLVE